jgi:hypothetical protein
MAAATALSVRDEIEGQWPGYWVEPGADPFVRPKYRPTGAVLRKRREPRSDQFECLDLVLVETPALGFMWLPLSEAGRYSYAHSLGLLHDEPWRLACWDVGDTVRVYEASYAEPMTYSTIAGHYGSEAANRARADRLTVQLRLRAISMT